MAGVKRLSWEEKTKKRQAKLALQEYERDLIRQSNEEKKATRFLWGEWNGAGRGH
jgi:hypothetical protein